MKRMQNGWRLSVASLLLGVLSACGGGGGGGSSEPTAQAAQTGQAVDISTRNLFPLSLGDTWVYDVTEVGSTTASAMTRTVVSGPDAVGQVQVRDVMGGSTDQSAWRIDGKGAAVMDPLGAEGVWPSVTAALPEFLELPSTSLTIGVPRTANGSGSLAVDWDGDGRIDNFSATITQNFHGMETIDVLGKATQVAHITDVTTLTIYLTSGQPAVAFTFTDDAYLASNLGVVRLKRSGVRSDGEVVVPPYTANLRAATVSGVKYNTVAAGLDKSEVVVTASRFSSGAGPQGTVLVSTQDASGRQLYVNESHSSAGISSVQISQVSSTQSKVLIQFAAPATRQEYTYNDTVSLKVCYDPACGAEIPGSPLKVLTSYLVTSEPANAPDLQVLNPVSRMALAHNVVDTKYSASLESAVMVSTWPSNALYLYDVATNTEKKLALSRVPTAVALSPDGKEAAVGHDGLVTWVDLTTLGAAAPTVKRLDLSAKAFDLVLDGYRHVHVIPETDQWVSLHSIDVATNTETLVGWLLRAGSHSQLNTAVGGLYTADNGLSPSDIARWNIVGGTASYVGDSRYHGDYPMCGNLWMSDDGARIFTACGNVFKANVASDKDMLYTGSLSLSSGTYGWYILSLSHSTATNEVALLEADAYTCKIIPGLTTPCYNHLSLYAGDDYGIKSKSVLGSIVVGGSSYPERGSAVFHGNGGRKLFMISRAEGSPDPASEYYFSVIR